MKRFLGAVLALFWASMAHATCAPPPFVFAPGQLIESSKMNANLQALVGCINAIPSPQGQTAIDPRTFGLLPAVEGFFTVSTIAGTGAVTVNGANFVQTHVGQYIRIAGAGPHELYYIGQIVGVSGATTISVTPSPTQTMTSFSTLVYFGPDGSGPINSACTAAVTSRVSVHFPAGVYMVAHPIQCHVVNYNNLNIPPPMITADTGAALVAVSDMADSLPGAHTLFTVGGLPIPPDTDPYTQFIRNAFIDGGGLTLDCSFLCDYAFALPFSQEVRVQNLQAKNTLVGGFHIGLTGQPTIGAFFGDHNKVDRDTFYVPISNITSAHPPVVTTTIDHGITTGRTVTVAGANNIPSPGPISFIAKSTGARTLELHNIDGSAWVAFAGTANLALTMPSNAAPHPIFGVTTANPTQISIDGDLNLTNGDTWCIYGVGGTGPNGTTGAPTNVPDGCYVVSNVGGVGGDGPFHFTVPVNTAGFTFTGGGTAYRLYASGGTIADMGFYLDNASDVQLSDNAIVGTRWPIYGSPVNSGFNGKYSHNHSSNLMEQGWIASGHVLGGSNSLLGEQVDTPAMFGATFSAGGNSSTGFGYNGSFPFIPDACCWIFRLDAGAVVANALSVTGTNGNGYSAGIRSSELSNHFTAGNPPYFGAIFNYTKSGGANAGNLLYELPDTRAGKSVFTMAPAGSPATASVVAVAGGLGAAGCQITPRTNGGLLHFEIHGTIQNDTIGDGAFVQLGYGTVSGGVPAAGAAFPLGTGVIGNAVGVNGEPAGGGGMSLPYTIGGIASVTPNVTYYWDSGFRAATGGTAQLGNSTCNAWEP